MTLRIDAVPPTGMGTGRALTRRGPGTLVLLAAAATVLLPAPATPLTAADVVVVVNDLAPASLRIGEYYQRVRGVASERVVRLRTEPREEIDRETYEREVEGPLGAFLRRHELHTQVLALVLTKGVPHKIRGTGGLNGTEASVDSELTLLGRRLLKGPVPAEGRVPNPYFRPGSPVRFTRPEFDIYLVTRLDGYTEEHARALVDRGMTPARQGTVVLDMQGEPAGGAATGDRWLRLAAERLRGSGLDVRLETTAAVVEGEVDVLGYVSWGSNDPASRARTPAFRWLPGALASWFVSTSARTFVPPPAGWLPSRRWDDPASHHAGSPQSLIGDLVAGGVTGAVGFAHEPYLDGTARPDIFLPAYRAGFTLAESFYMALPYLSWQSVVIGDPLVAPWGPSPSPAR